MLNSKLGRPIVGLAVGILLGGAYAASPASAAPAGPDATLAASTLASSLDRSLGDRSAGSYMDGGKLVVNVTDSATAASVKASGATPRFVQRSGAQLAAVSDKLTAKLTTPGTTFGVDPITNKVLVTADSTVTGAKLDAVKSLVASFGGAATFQAEPGTLSPTISGGDAIYTSAGRCSLGFNVRNSQGTSFFLTAGHCTNIGLTWTTSNGTALGTRTGSSFPENDYGIVQYTNSSISKPGAVGSQDITSAATPAVNANVTRRGSTTGIHTGRVTGLNTVVNYAEGTVRGMIRTTVCAERGDSGGSLYSGSTALGLTSGGNGNCSSGGTTYFQPVTEALGAFSVNVY